ncbi:MAG TPA: hypothetical protein VKU62_07240 [Thermoanaerobaculia bacterium]|nr:hypothetical protein [Thermoanaerobaculia bacterium]
MHIVGLDIGFSARKRTNAIAELRDEVLTLRRLSIEERNKALEHLTDVDVLAIDAPILSSDAPQDLVRRCERVFVSGLFSMRCKPGMSHIGGTGRLLREHGMASAQLGRRSTGRAIQLDLPRVIDGCNIVEAFPNAFLGVSVDASDCASRAGKRSRKKFDWLYDQWLTTGRFPLAVQLAGLPTSISDACQAERHHEKRAALVCLMTAGFAMCGRYVAIGHRECGYFFLPPKSIWSDWAWHEVNRLAGSSGAQVIEKL